MTVRVKPAASRSLRASMDSQARSPESRRIPARSRPCARSRLPVSMALRTPWSVSYVSTSRTTLCGIALAYASKASRSESNNITQECACVPRTGIPRSLPASTFEVAAQPPMYAARAALSAPSGPCALRNPNSRTGSPCAARQTRAALVAISVWKLIRLSSGDSRSMQGTIGPETRSSGSCGKTAVPSGTASMSTRGSSSRRWSRNARSNIGSPDSARNCARERTSSSVKLSCRTYSSAGPRPAAMVKPDLKGGRRKTRWKTASRSSTPAFHAAAAMLNWYRSVSSESGCPYSSRSISQRRHAAAWAALGLTITSPLSLSSATRSPCDPAEKPLDVHPPPCRRSVLRQRARHLSRDPLQGERRRHVLGHVLLRALLEADVGQGGADLLQLSARHRERDPGAVGKHRHVLAFRRERGGELFGRGLAGVSPRQRPGEEGRDAQGSAALVAFAPQDYVRARGVLRVD